MSDPVFIAPLMPHRSPQSDAETISGACRTSVRSFWPSKRNEVIGVRGRIAGTVAEKGTPNRPMVCPLYIYDEWTHQLVSATWSVEDGSYVFYDLDLTRRYTVIGYDRTHTYRAVIADNLQPEL